MLHKDILLNEIRRIERQRAITVAIIIGLVLVIVILLFLWRSYSKAHQLSKDLSSSNRILANERDNLKDTQRDLIEARDRAKAAERVKTDFVMSLNHEMFFSYSRSSSVIEWVTSHGYTSMSSIHSSHHFSSHQLPFGLSKV